MKRKTKNKHLHKANEFFSQKVLISAFVVFLLAILFFISLGLMLKNNIQVACHVPGEGAVDHISEHDEVLIKNISGAQGGNNGSMPQIKSTNGFEVKILSPQNETYNITNVILNVSVTSLSSEIFRSIDNNPNATECNNCTGFTRYNLIFSNGTHDIKVYAENPNGVLVMDEIEFSIQK
jgi:hypothetical protein